MKNRVLICDSILQVINTKAAIQKLYKINKHKFNDYVIIVHPELTEKNKKLIMNISKKLGYSGVFDYSNSFTKD